MLKLGCINLITLKACQISQGSIAFDSDVRWLGGSLKKLQLSILSQPLWAPEKGCVHDQEWDLKNCWLTANCYILVAY